MRSYVPARGLLLLVIAAGVALAAASGARADVFSNTNPITINDAPGDNCGVDEGLATPYPSTISVSGLTGTITKVTVTLTGLTHTFPDDVAVLLVGPGGQTTLLMTDSGGGNGVSGVNLTFDDSAGGALPDEDQIVSGTYTTSFGAIAFGCFAPSTFPSPAPAGSYGTELAAFVGTDPNGTWSLYVLDDASQDSGSISGGWSLDISTAALAVTVSSFRATRVHAGVTLRWRTASEVETLGFNVYRSQHGRRVRVNRRLIPALSARRGGVAGGAYTYLDRRAPHRAVRYWLQEVARDGSRTWHGSVRAPAS